MKRFLPLALLLAGCGASDEFTPTGSVAPDFKVQTLSIPSSGVSLAKRKGKVALIDYWATWCGPCKAISPMMEAIYERYKGDGLEAMAITNEAREIVALAEKERPHKMPVYLDADDDAYKKLGIQALPTIIVVDRKGHIAFRSTGFSDPGQFALEVETAVQKALAE